MQPDEQHSDHPIAHTVQLARCGADAHPRRIDARGRERIERWIEHDALSVVGAGSLLLSIDHHEHLVPSREQRWLGCGVCDSAEIGCELRWICGVMVAARGQHDGERERTSARDAVYFRAHDPAHLFRQEAFTRTVALDCALRTNHAASVLPGALARHGAYPLRCRRSSRAGNAGHGRQRCARHLASAEGAAGWRVYEWPARLCFPEHGPALGKAPSLRGTVHWT